MVAGAGTPLVQSISSSDVIAASGDLATSKLSPSLHENKSKYLGGRVPRLDELVTLSPDAMDHLGRQKSLLRRLENGRGEIARQADQLIRDQLSQARDQVAFLHNLLRHSDPYSSKALKGSIRGVGENILRLSKHIGGSGVAADVSGISLSKTEVNVKALNIKAEFNKISKDGNQIKSEKLSVELSFIQVDISQTELKITSNEGSSSFLNAIQQEFEDLVDAYLEKTFA